MHKLWPLVLKQVINMGHMSHFQQLFPIVSYQCQLRLPKGWKLQFVLFSPSKRCISHSPFNPISLKWSLLRPHGNEFIKFVLSILHMYIISVYIEGLLSEYLWSIKRTGS